MSGPQSLFIVRHGDRWDYSHPEWLETAQRKGDPPLSTLGHQQARETGIFLDKLLTDSGIVDGKDIAWMSSPFLRTIQTSDEALNMMSKVRNIESVKILPEYSIFELDGHDGKLHADLPEMIERTMYFPRVDADYESLFIPPLPESRTVFLKRCDDAIAALAKRHSYKPNTAIVMVTHAAACVGLTKSAAQLGLEDVNPAGPCGVFRVQRWSDTTKWELDHYSKEGGYNGHLGHLSQMGKTTYPWNNFGDKQVNKGYTGPPGGNCKP
uniref:Phosphoglycerate mutase-like protein n=1 Tax=Grammatophora oceanica TaxID=210454 RepID=A0A7S1YC87_9STRA